MLLFSFALADRINLLKKEKYESERKVLEAKALSEAKSHFLAKMSHEIRTPMNGVLGMAELLRTSELPSLQKHYADVIHGSGKALLSVINDILDHAKIEAGKMKLETIPFNLDTLLNECASVFAISARDKQLSLLTHLNPNTPIGLKGDPTRLRQILLNLLSNAFKFTEHGEIIINASVDSYQNNTDTVRIKFEVKDTGIGIDKKDQLDLFRPYSQADDSIVRRFGGTGLGLTISRQLIELMKGEIGIKSERGKGSIFWFTATFQLADKNELPLPIFDLSLLNNRRLLVIDDDATFCTIIQNVAAIWGMHSQIAYTGRSGLNTLMNSDKLFDIVILDMHLPDCEGLKLSKEIKEMKNIKPSPILLVTGVEQIPSLERLKDIGIVLALEKPMSNQQLCDALIHIISNQEQQLQTLITNDSGNKCIQSMSVLVAEDNTVNQLVIEGLLTKLAVQTKLVGNGEETVQIIEAKHNQFDVVLMDCEMPELDGYEATKKIRAFEALYQLPRLPIIALTAHAMQEYRQKSLEAGMDDHIAKPINLDELREKLLYFSSKQTPHSK